jgi:CheY-like chemotaxis protein
MDTSGQRAVRARLKLAAGDEIARATRGVIGYEEEVLGMSGGKDTSTDTSRDTTRRVLVVDDDPALVALIADGLRMLGRFDVASASDGAAGLQRFFELAPDCVVVDIRMPGLNGYQFIRALRGDPDTAQTPIVVLSALVQDRDALAGLLSGADAYLFKPVTIADLLRTIDESIHLSQEQRSLRTTRLVAEGQAH